MRSTNDRRPRCAVECDSGPLRLGRLGIEDTLTLAVSVPRTFLGGMMGEWAIHLTVVGSQ